MRFAEINFSVYPRRTAMTRARTKTRVPVNYRLDPQRPAPTINHADLSRKIYIVRFGRNTYVAYARFFENIKNRSSQKRSSVDIRTTLNKTTEWSRGRSRELMGKNRNRSKPGAGKGTDRMSIDEEKYGQIREKRSKRTTS